MMTQTAQAALRRVIEQYTKNVRFCIVCNYVNKIIPAIQSRCTRFRFGPLQTSEVEQRLAIVEEHEKVKITPEGRKALLRLSKGDMRRALNVLQACHAAYDDVDENAVYNCTGAPHPADIETMVQSMMVDDFSLCYHIIFKSKIDRGLALQDLIGGVYDFVQDVELPARARIYLLDQLATVEHRLSTGGNEKLQLSGLVGSFKHGMQIASHVKSG